MTGRALSRDLVRREGGSEIQFHLGVDQAAADAEHAVAEDGGSEGGVEETTGDGFELGVVEFVRSGDVGDVLVVGWSAHIFDLVLGWLGWLVLLDWGGRITDSVPSWS